MQIYFGVATRIIYIFNTVWLSSNQIFKNSVNHIKNYKYDLLNSKQNLRTIM